MEGEVLLSRNRMVPARQGCPLCSRANDGDARLNARPSCDGLESPGLRRTSIARNESRALRRARGILACEAEILPTLGR